MTKTARIATAAATGMLLAACTATRPDLASSGCEWIRPIRLAGGDVLTEPTAREILAHNLIWERICKPGPTKGPVKE